MYGLKTWIIWDSVVPKKNLRFGFRGLVLSAREAEVQAFGSPPEISVLM